jgi:hypothetical protein
VSGDGCRRVRRTARARRAVTAPAAGADGGAAAERVAETAEAQHHHRPGRGLGHRCADRRSARLVGREVHGAGPGPDAAKRGDVAGAGELDQQRVVEARLVRHVDRREGGEAVGRIEGRAAVVRIVKDVDDAVRLGGEAIADVLLGQGKGRLIHDAVGVERTAVDAENREFVAVGTLVDGRRAAALDGKVNGSQRRRGGGNRSRHGRKTYDLHSEYSPIYGAESSGPSVARVDTSKLFSNGNAELLSEPVHARSQLSHSFIFGGSNRKGWLIRAVRCPGGRQAEQPSRPDGSRLLVRRCRETEPAKLPNPSG